MVSLMDCFQERAWRAVRASMFTALGLYGIVPIVHQFMLNSHVPQIKLALNYDLLMGATYIVSQARRRGIAARNGAPRRRKVPAHMPAACVCGPGALISVLPTQRLTPASHLACACVQLGAIIYANRVPERWFPGRFDLFCHSHQIFHVSLRGCGSSGEDGRQAHVVGAHHMVAVRV
jgi:hypothetical protein